MRTTQYRLSGSANASTTIPNSSSGHFGTDILLTIARCPEFCSVDVPQLQRDIVEAVDALTAKTLSNVQRAVKCGIAYYGVGEGWCFSLGGFAEHVTLMFINGATLLDPAPTATPVGMGKATRSVDLGTLDDLDEAPVAAWMRQITSAPATGSKRR